MRCLYVALYTLQETGLLDFKANFAADDGRCNWWLDSKANPFASKGWRYCARDSLGTWCKANLLHASNLLSRGNFLFKISIAFLNFSCFKWRVPAFTKYSPWICLIQFLGLNNWLVVETYFVARNDVYTIAHEMQCSERWKW